MPTSGRAGSILRNTWALTWYERVVRHFHLDDLRRGSYEVGPARLRIRDVFGRDAAESEMAGREVLTVVPRGVPVEHAPAARAPLGERRATHSLTADPALFSGVRPFQAGDSLRRIHWRATARLGTTVSRRFEPARGRSVVLAIDVQTLPDVAHWEMAYDEDAFEGLCVTAISLARRYLDDGAAVGIAAASFSGTTQRVAWLAPRAGMSHLARAGELLARIGPVSSISYGQLLGWLGRRLAPGHDGHRPHLARPRTGRADPAPPRVERARRRGRAARRCIGATAMMTARVAHLTPSWQNADGLRIS